MKIHSFVIVASGLDPLATDFVDRLVNAGCSDATISFERGVIVLDFDRESASFRDAVKSAIDDVKRAGAKVRRVEPDHLVTMADIAQRADVSRSAVSLWASGQRGEIFPPPVARVTSDGPMWDWSEVAHWLHGQSRLDAESVKEANAIRDANHWLLLYQWSTVSVSSSAYYSINIQKSPVSKSAISIADAEVATSSATGQNADLIVEMV